MADPRIAKLAQILVHYALEIQPGQRMVIRTNPLAEELTLAASTSIGKRAGKLGSPFGLRPRFGPNL